MPPVVAWVVGRRLTGPAPNPGWVLLSSTVPFHELEYLPIVGCGSRALVISPATAGAGWPRADDRPRLQAIEGQSGEGGMARIFLTHAGDARAHYYGDEALARLRELGEVRLNETGAPLTSEQLIELRPRLPRHRLRPRDRGARRGVRATARARRLRALRGRHQERRRRRRLGRRRPGHPGEPRLRRCGGRARDRPDGRSGARHLGCHDPISRRPAARRAHGPAVARQHARHRRLRPHRHPPRRARPRARHARSCPRSPRPGGRAGAHPDRPRDAPGRAPTSS